MNFETSQTKTPDKPLNVFEKDKITEEELNDELINLQLFYAQDIFQYQDNDSEKAPATFADCLDRKSNIFLIIKDYIDTAINQGRADNSQKVEEEMARLKSRVNEIYDRSVKPEPSQTKDLGYYFSVKESLRELDRYISQETADWRAKAGCEKPDIGNQSDQTGLFQYRRTQDDDYRDKVNFIEGTGIEISFPGIFDSQNKFIGVQKIKENLSLLAEKLLVDHPETSKIMTTSWLLDHPLMKKLINFKILGEDERINTGQFITNGNQINRSRFKSLILTGQPEYKNLIGEIDFEKFLSDFLPADKKGPVKLRKPSPHYEAVQTDKKMIGQELSILMSEWNLNRGINLDLDNLWSQYPEIYKIMGKIDRKNQFIDILQAGQGQCNWLDLDSQKLGDIGRRLEAYFESDKYIDVIKVIE